MNTSSYLKDQIPTPPEGRQSYADSVIACARAGWGSESDETLATIVAILRGESAGDPRCFLAYIEYTWDTQKRKDIIRKKLAKIPRSYDWDQFAAALAPIKNARLVAADRGLLQISSYWHNVPNSKAFDPVFNLDYCYEHLYVGWDKTFNAWAAYTNGSYKAFISLAREAVKQYRATVNAASEQPPLVIDTPEAPVLPPVPTGPGPSQPAPARTGPYLRYKGHKYYKQDQATFKQRLKASGILWWFWVKYHPIKAREVFGLRVNKQNAVENIPDTGGEQ